MKKVEIRHLGKRYGDRVLFQDVNLCFESNGLYVILGDSGCGKTTLLDLIAGLDVDFTGEILTLGSLLKEKSEEERCRFRLERIGYIRQTSDLLELESALENVLLPLKACSNLSPRLARRKALDLLSFFGLKDKTQQKANTLSGGERQRVALARALVNDPQILLADEPTGALDAENADFLYRALQQLAEKRLVLVVSHDVSRSEKYAGHLLFLHQGCFCAKSNLPSEETGPNIATLTTPKIQGVRPSFLLWFQRLSSFARQEKSKFPFVLDFVFFTFVLGVVSVCKPRSFRKSFNRFCFLDRRRRGGDGKG